MHDDPAAILAGIRERNTTASTYDTWHLVGRDVSRLLVAAEVVLDLHAPIVDGSEWCRECGHSFPCWTRRSITSALTGTQLGEDGEHG